MTYCLSLLCREGVVFLADSRTSAGVDNITVHPKMRVYAREGDRVFCLMSSGNLSITQSVSALLDHDLAGDGANLLNRANFYETVRYVGGKIREVSALDAEALKRSGLTFDVNLILGGQIGMQPAEIYKIYAEGNAIHASVESPFLQIGELKYGKPILDRGFTFETPLKEAVKFGLLSLDATAKSNLSVGTPFEIFSYEAGSLAVRHRVRLDENDGYLKRVREDWQRGLSELVSKIPPLDFES
jgi:putative proteasome-type protease